MSSDFFLQIEGIEGDSNDSKHAKWIEVKSFNHGASQSVDIKRGADVSGRGAFEPFVFTHSVDKATPKIQQFCMNGKDIKKCTFHACRAISGKQTVVYELKFENVKIIQAQVKTVEINDTDGRLISQQPIEEVSLYYKKMTWKVVPVKPDNTLDGPVETNFDQIENK
ncbi:MAG: type VI secretion system tube protein Hcp [Candidatus Riflebacteria bacterium]|jgi:type VI secretion system secreted protein Hcp|nr:type VI secretion system tube protein Hcp [Candidatus Riflebacteria bacterium]MBQ2592720.1 type VI secretion system tube protein Hcp [Candidatus Riflebacteria bacterium]